MSINQVPSTGSMERFSLGQPVYREDVAELIELCNWVAGQRPIQHMAMSCSPPRSASAFYPDTRLGLDLTESLVRPAVENDWGSSGQEVGTLFVSASQFSSQSQTFLLTDIYVNPSAISGVVGACGVADHETVEVSSGVFQVFAGAAIADFVFIGPVGTVTQSLYFDNTVGPEEEQIATFPWTNIGHGWVTMKLDFYRDPLVFTRSCYLRQFRVEDLPVSRSYEMALMFPATGVLDLTNPAGGPNPLTGSITGSGDAGFPFNATNMPVLWLQTHSTRHMWQEDASSGGTPITHASQSSAVSAVDDPALFAHRWEAQSNTTRPFLQGASGSLNCGLFFSGAAGTAARMTCYNSQESLKFLHLLTGAIAFKMLSVEDGRTQNVLDNSGQSTANVGVSLIKTSTDHLQFIVEKGLSGHTCINHTTVATCRQATGAMNVLILLGQPTCSIKVGTEPWETMAVTGPLASITASANSDLSVGGIFSSNTNGFNGMIGSLMAWSGTVSDGTLGAYTASFNPSLTDHDLVVSQSLGMANFLYGWYDFSNSTTVFSDSQGTVPLAVGQRVANVAHVLDASGGLRRYATDQAPSVPGPLWLGGIQGAYFSGSAAPNNLSLRNAMHTGGGASYFIVCRNDNVTSGSHVMATTPGGDYWVQTGRDYPNGALGSGSPYHLMHFANGNASRPVLLEQPTGINILELRRDGSVTHSRTWGNGLLSSTSSLDVAAGSGFAPGNIGASGSAGWPMSGSIMEVMLFNTFLTVPEANLVLDQLRHKWGNV
jgi:hypothetical protein